MKTKIQIKTVFGKVIFEYKKEDNTIKDTLIKAVNSGAYLRDANLSGAYLYDVDGSKIKIKKIAVFTGLYTYPVYTIIDSRNSKWIKMGCFLRRLNEWEKDFWNNNDQFPNNDSERSNLRLFAFETVKQWFNIVKNEKIN